MWGNTRSSRSPQASVASIAGTELWQARRAGDPLAFVDAFRNYDTAAQRRCNKDLHVNQRKWRLSIGAIVKDEERYIEEWVLYHHLIGVEHFFILDHGSTDATRTILAPYVNRGLVTVIDWPLIQGQIDGYAFLVRLAAGMTEWMAIIDMDEFIRLNGPADLPTFLAGVDADQVLCRWQFYGHSGHRARPEGLVVENFVMAQDGYADQVKSIFRPETVVKAGVHAQITVNGRTQTAGGDRALEAWRVSHRRGGNPVQVNHYYSRSWEEYEHKMRRGDALRNREQLPKTFADFDYPLRDETLVPFGATIRRRAAAIAALPVDPAIYGSLAGGVVRSCGTTFNYLARDWMLDLADRLGEPGKPAGTFRKSDRGARMEMRLGNNSDVLMATLPSYLQEMGIQAQAQPLGPVAFDAPLELRLADDSLPGYVFVAFIAQAESATGFTVHVESTGADGAIIQEERINLSGAGLWLGVQIVNLTPASPRTLTITNADDRQLAIPALAGWLVS